MPRKRQKLNESDESTQASHDNELDLSFISSQFKIL